LLQPPHLAAEVLRPGVVVEGHDVRLPELDLSDLAEAFPVGRAVDSPDAAREGLSGARLPRPCERLRQEGRHPGRLVLELLLGIAAEVVGAGLVPDVPGQDTVVLRERSYGSSHVGLQAGILAGVAEGHGTRLWTQPELWTPGTGGCWVPR